MPLNLPLLIISVLIMKSCVQMTIIVFDFRGVSSTVRKCVEKLTSKEYAVKVIDLTNDKNDTFSPEEMIAITRKETNILRLCAGQPYISRFSTFIIVFFKAIVKT